MPQLVRFLIRHALIGFAVAIGFVALFLAFDLHGLRTLIVQSPEGLLAAAVLSFAMCLTFGSVQMGVAVMLLPREEDDEEPRGGKGARSRLRLRPAQVRVRR